MPLLVLLGIIVILLGIAFYAFGRPDAGRVIIGVGVVLLLVYLLLALLDGGDNARAAVNDAVQLVKSSWLKCPASGCA